MPASSKDDICVEFNINDLITKNIKFLQESIPNENVCVVSVIGKSSLNSCDFKQHVIADALGKHIFKNEKEEKPTVLKTDVKGYYDAATHSIFLEMVGVSDTNVLMLICKEMEEDLKAKSFLEVWSDMHYDYAKTLLLLFCISHIIVVVHPVATFDLSYVYLFRALDSIRTKSLPWFREILSGISPEWVQSGRPCSPRVLFVFESCHLVSYSDTSVRHKKQSPLKKLEHCLEDQIYRILRKSRVITNISGNSLFAVPANQEFVYIFSTKPFITDFVGFYLDEIRHHCQMAKDLDAQESYTVNKEADHNHSFSKFLLEHINLALTKGFDDNVGRYPVPAYFELASTHTWFKVVNKLAYAFYNESNKVFCQTVRASTDTDVKFSEGRCTKVLPLASAAYQDNLPTHYTEDYHQTRLAHALHVFNMNARGPAVQRFAQQLQQDCERLWKSGHQMCEVLSLTGNHCMNALHRTEEEDADESLPTLQHCSQVKLVSTCDCGRKQATRDDPFDVKTANCDFYLNQRAQCCRDLERMDFPIFCTEEMATPPTLTATADVTTELLSEGNSDEMVAEIENTDDDSQEEREEIVIRIQEDSSKYEKVLKRQLSTTEYLPGMLHSESKPNLLPKFSSWSLVCLGPSSLYSHNIGLQDQPGFIPGTNYLLPWDVTVKLEQKERWPALWEGKRPLSLKAKKAIRDGPQFNVKIFLGVEYECYRGHRFMCSAPDRVLRVTNSGHVKDNASKVTSSDMPLYFPCPCRSSKPQLAQLMRIHVVTPKAPVHVTLNPKVQPSPDPCPLFFPTLDEPLKLSQSAYWVLRLPFVYESESGPYFPPTEPIANCRLLKGTYNIAEQQSSR